MKAIELTKGHKDKLLEMCRKLFPKYKWQFASDYGSINDDTQVDSLIQWKTTGKYSQSMINTFHWFEFCMTHLVEKIFNLFNEDDEDFYDRYINNGASFYGVGVNEIIFVMLSSKEHPVDYLYEEFKKLKN